MKKRYIKLIVILAVLVFGFTSCAGAGTDTVSNTEDTATKTITETTAVQTATVDTTELESLYTVAEAVSYSDEDKDADYNENTAVKIILADDQTVIEGGGASAQGDTITITSAGTYIISGQLTDGQLVVSADKEDVVQMVLDNAVIHNTNGPAVIIEQAEKAIITLAENSANELSDGETYEDTGDDAPDAAVYASDDLTINGSGELMVKGNYKHAVKTVDDLVITGGTLNITAVSDGLRGKDSVAVLDGDITIESGGAGIKSTEDEDAEKGWVSIDGGTLNIDSDDNGLQAETVLMISAGDITINAAQDTLHCNAHIQILGGDMVMNAGDDGAHADDTLYIADGIITIQDSYEGLEGALVIIDGGDITAVADDDGINAAGGSDNSAGPSDQFSDKEGYYIIINGGNVYVSAQGDGVDSNGDIYITGGTVVVDGPTSGGNSAIDIERSNFVVTGGTLIAAGSSGMLVSPTQATQPVVTIVFSTTQQAGSLVTVTDENGNQLFTIDPEKTYQSVMISSPEITQGMTIGILFGGQFSGDTTNPTYYTDGSVSGETSSISVTIDSLIMTIDENGNETQITGTFGGGGGGGRGGRPQGGDMPEDGTRPQDGGMAPPQQG